MRCVQSAGGPCRYLTLSTCILLFVLFLIGCSRTGQVVGEVNPPKAVIYTACGYITDLATDREGGLWAATKGGVLQWSNMGKPPKILTTADGLPANEIRSIALVGSKTYAALPTTLVEIDASGSVTDIGSELKGQEIKEITAADDTLWVGTSKVLYTMEKEGRFIAKIKGDVERLEANGGEVLAVIDQKLFRSDRKEPIPIPQETGHITGLAVSGDDVYLSGVFGLWRLRSGRWTDIQLPKSAGSHVSAIESSGDDGIYAAVYGDALYTVSNGRWTKLQDTPESFKRITTITTGFKGPIVGTQDDAVWISLNRGWVRYVMPPYLSNADIYGVAAFDDSVWAATFDRGLLRLVGDKWTSYTRSHGLSTGSPRDLVVYQNKLYVRHTTGQLDVFDGQKFARAFDKSQVPREVYSIYTDGKRLYLGAFGGWITTDGRHWEHHFKQTALGKQVVTAIAADDDTVWIGTQKAGLFKWKDNKLTHLHESSGLTDDWITCIAVKDKRVLVGTYVGGLLESDGDRFRQVMTPEGFWVRAVTFLKYGRAAAATPLGVYVESEGKWNLLPPSRYGGLETQTLCPTSKGVWVGGRTALAFMPVD